MGIVTPQSCSLVALASPFPALPATCGNDLQEYSWEHLYKTHMQIANLPSPWSFAKTLSKSSFTCASFPLFSVLLGVEVMKSRGSPGWPASVQGVVSCPVPRLWVLEDGRHTYQIFHWHTSGKSSYLER